jgi:uncharacterized OB-fold protein
MAYTGPMPMSTEETEGFWAAAKKKVFTLHRCGKCGTSYWPASACRKCKNDPFLANMTWEKASGKGKIFSFIVVRRAFHPAFPPPYVYALVKLDEGPLFPCAVEVAPEKAKVGMPVEVRWTELSPEWNVPKFFPAA